MYILSLSLVLLKFTTLVYTWNPDAGYVTSWTKMAGVKATASSRPESVGNILDNNDNTHWMSDSCLPTGFYSHANDNVLFGLCAQNHCNDSTGSQNDFAKVTDGDVYTMQEFPVGANGHAHLSIQLKSTQELHFLTINGVYEGDTVIKVEHKNRTSKQLRVLTKTDSYKRITLNNIIKIAFKIVLQSSKSFKIKEIAALSPNGCSESVTVDLGTPRDVGVIRTRHWAGTGAATSVTLQTSLDNISWKIVTPLNPEALHAVTTNIIPSQTVRYIKVEYTLVQKNYVKVYCWQVDAWDQHHQWGPPVEAKPQKNAMKDILGVNGIWGWQHSKYSNGLKPGEGPFLYNAIASHARNYHNMDWDVTDPSKDPQYCEMENGHGTQAKSWLSWDQEYKAWRNANMLIDVSFQFTNKQFPQSNWYNPEQEAFNLGRHFANHFGREHGNGLINAVEVGNEPWDYTSSFYNKVLKGMSAGLRNVDSKIKILPGAFQAHEKHDTGNYIGTRVTQDLAANISIVNFHTYSYRNSVDGKRIGTYPEHEDSSFNSLRNIVRWRDSNLPTKPIWVTEWGWDADGKGESCTFPECVTEEAQAIYGVRGLLILARTNIEKVTWFFYANSQSCNTLYCRSGLTASISHNFAKKNVFYAFEELNRFIGNKYFLGIYQENKKGYVYVFSSTVQSESFKPSELLAHGSHVLAWKPTDASDSVTSQIHLNMPNGVYPSSVKRFTGSHPAVVDVGAQIINGNTWTLEISTKPLLIELSGVHSGQVVG